MSLFRKYYWAVNWLVIFVLATPLVYWLITPSQLKSSQAPLTSGGDCFLINRQPCFSAGCARKMDRFNECMRRRAARESN